MCWVFLSRFDGNRCDFNYHIFLLNSSLANHEFSNEIKLKSVSYIVLFLFVFIIKQNFCAQVFSNNGIFSIQDLVNTEIPIPVDVPNPLTNQYGLEKVCFELNHASSNDLQIKLISPTGRSVSLMHRLPGSTPSTQQICLNDSLQPIYLFSPPLNGSYRPYFPLGQFNNGNIENGIWKLMIEDQVSNAIGGQLLNVTLTFSSNPAATCNFDVSPNLPVIHFKTESQAIGDYSKVKVKMDVFEGQGPHFPLQDTPTIQLNSFIEWQGWSSTNLPKKNFDLDLCDSTGVHIDYPLLGLPKENDWVLKAEYIDQTSIKNAFVYQLFRDMGHYAPRSQFCVVYLDGECLGLYTLLEKVKKDKNRVKIEDLADTSLQEPELSGGYLFELNPTGANPDWTSSFPPITDPTTSYNVEFKLVYPKRNSIPVEQLNYLQHFVDSFENALMYLSFNDSNGYKKYIDEETFCDFLLINEFSANYDSYGRSTYLRKENRKDLGKLKMGPIWDCDQTFGHYYPSTEGWVWQITNDYWPFPFWWSKLWQDSSFRSEVACRWVSYRQDVLSESRLNNLIDSLYLSSQVGAQISNEIWPSAHQLGQQQAILELKNFIQNRLHWMDSLLFVPNQNIPVLLFNESLSICFGDSISYLADSSLLVNWIPGPEASYFTPQQSGLYQLEITNDEGCFARSAFFVNVNKPQALFEISFLDGNDSISLISIDSSLSAHYWLINTDTISYVSNPIYQFPQNGSYTILHSVQDSANCQDTSHQVFTVNTIGIEQLKLLLYPNPTGNNAILVCTEELLNQTTYLMDEKGAILKKIDLKEINIPIDLSPLSPGKYFFVCKENVFSFVKR